MITGSSDSTRSECIAQGVILVHILQPRVHRSPLHLFCDDELFYNPKIVPILQQQILSRMGWKRRPTLYWLGTTLRLVCSWDVHGSLTKYAPSKPQEVSNVLFSTSFRHSQQGRLSGTKPEYQMR